MPHDRDAALKLIRSNIERHGYHVYLIRGGALPDFCYTIGLSPRLGAELIMAGASYYSSGQRQDVIPEISELPQRLDGGARVVRREQDCFADYRCGNARRCRAVEVRHAARGYLVVPAVEVADEAHDLGFPGVAARKPEREV